MAGYTRQSAGDIVAGAVVKAAPVDNEFQQVLAAFATSTGHKHNNATGEGGYVPLIADADGLNKVVVDTSNNRVGIFTEVSSAAVEQVRFQDGAILPVTTNDINLGSGTYKFKDAFINGNATVGGTFGATGNSSFGGTLCIVGVSTHVGKVCAVDVKATGTSTLSTVDIGAGNIDGTVIGASAVAAGSFSTLSTTGQGTFATADINGGTADNMIIGGSTPAAVTGTTITANTCFVGALTGNVTGNIGGNVTGNAVGCHTGHFDGIIGASTPAAATGTTITANTCFVGALVGNVTGNVGGNLTGDVTGNIGSTGTSTFCDINMSGTAGLDMGSAKITSVGAPSASTDVSTKGYVDTAISNLIGDAGAGLDTLGELADALNDDDDFSATVTNSIATKMPLAGGTFSGDVTLGSQKITSSANPATNDTLTRKAYVDAQDATKLNLSGGTMSGAIAMGTAKITGLGDPGAAQDASTKAYTDTQRDTRLATGGGTMSGTLDMGSQKITTTYTPQNAADLTTKTYVDGILGSATAAASSATAASNSASAAASSATAASNSASAASTSATNAAASYDAFDDRYLGNKSSDPSQDNDGNSLLTGALYWNTNSNALKVYTGSAWASAAFTLGDALTDIVQDTSPQLGGNLDGNSKCITGAANICATNFYGAFTGNVTGCVSTLGNHDTADLAEGTNLYYTDARVNSHLSGGTGVTYNDGAISIGQSVATNANPTFASVCLGANPTTSCQAATKEYVDTIAAAGLHYHEPVRVQTTGNLAAGYSNGSSGVGATLTNSGTQAAVAIDGVTLNVNDRVLVSSQTNAAHNGVYKVTTAGNGSTNWVLTRSTDTDSYGPSDQDAFGQGDAFFISQGTVNAGHLDVMNVAGTITFGTTNITFAEVAESSIYSAGNGLNLAGTSFSVGAGTGVTVNSGNVAIGQAVETNSNVQFNQVTAALVGNASTASTLASSRNIALTGAVTGTVGFNGSGDVSITTTATSDPQLTIDGDASGTATFTNLGNATLTLTIADDSHNHTVANVDGLATCLSAKASTTCAGTIVTCLAGKAAIAGVATQNFSAKCVTGANCMIAPVICGTTCVVAPDINATSDCRCKSNIVTVENAYCKLNQIRGVNYNWKDSGKYTIGVIAQEVEEVLPELVTTDDDGMKAVNYNGIVGVLVETVKCLQSKVEELENGSKG